MALEPSWRRASRCGDGVPRLRDGERRERWACPAPARSTRPALPVGAAVLVAARGAESPPCAGCRRRRAARGRASPCRELTLQRAEGGRSQLYDGDAAGGRRAVREGLRPRQPGRRSPVPRLPQRSATAARTRSGQSPSLKRDVEHEALMLLAGADGLACGARSSRSLTALPSGSMVLALEDVTAAGSMRDATRRDRRRAARRDVDDRPTLSIDVGSRTAPCAVEHRRAWPLGR